jgi:hypothetical protein
MYLCVYGCVCACACVSISAEHAGRGWAWQWAHNRQLPANVRMVWGDDATDYLATFTRPDRFPLLLLHVYYTLAPDAGAQADAELGPFLR